MTNEHAKHSEHADQEAHADHDVRAPDQDDIGAARCGAHDPTDQTVGADHGLIDGDPVALPRIDRDGLPTHRCAA